MGPVITKLNNDGPQLNYIYCHDYKPNKNFKGRGLIRAMKKIEKKMEMG